MNSRQPGAKHAGLSVSWQSPQIRRIVAACFQPFPPASQALAARQTSGWKCQEVDFELGKVQEVEENFRQVVILQSGNNNNNNEFHWLESIASVPISRSYIFKEKGCECRVTLGMVLIPAVLARLCCHVVLLDFELLIWKADRKPDTNETLNGTKEDDEESITETRLFLHLDDLVLACSMLKILWM